MHRPDLQQIFGTRGVTFVEEVSLSSCWNVAWQSVVLSPRWTQFRPKLLGNKSHRPTQQKSPSAERQTGMHGFTRRLSGNGDEGDRTTGHATITGYARATPLPRI